MKTEDLKGTDRTDFVHSPFRYPGHQMYALDTLLSIIPRHRFYIEPFCGGGSTFFGKKKAESNWLNDIDRELIETYKVIRNQPEKLIAALLKENTSTQRYNPFKSEFTPKNSFETALRWFYLNRTSRIETTASSKLLSVSTIYAKSHQHSSFTTFFKYAIYKNLTISPWS